MSLLVPRLCDLLLTMASVGAERTNSIEVAFAFSRKVCSGGGCGGFALPRRRRGGAEMSLSTPSHDWALDGRRPGVVVVADMRGLLVSDLGLVAGPLGVGGGGFVRVGAAARG